MFDLQKLRLEKGLSQKEAAELLGCKQPNISAIENNGKDLTEDQLNILIKLYGNEYVNSFYSKQNIVSDEIPEYKKSTQLDLVLDIMNKQADSLAKKDEQIDRLITLLENQLNEK